MRAVVVAPVVPTLGLVCLTPVRVRHIWRGTDAGRPPMLRRQVRRLATTARMYPRFLRLLRAADLRLLAALFVLVGAAWTFVVVADEVIEGDTLSFDERVVVFFRNPADPTHLFGPPIVTEAVRDLTALGGVVVITLITLLAVGFLLLARKVRAAVFMVVAIGGGSLVSLGMKHLFARPRPALVPHLSEVMTTSFPSGHSTLSAIVYLTLAALLGRLVTERGLKLYLLSTALLLTFLVGLSRVMLGVHYPTDVLAGWMLGLVWAMSCWVVMVRLQRRGAVDVPSPTQDPQKSDPQKEAASPTLASDPLDP